MATETVCPRCGGTGWVIRERANLSGAEPCGCRMQERASRVEERAQIPPLYRNASFDTFSIRRPDNPTAERELTAVFLAVKAFARDYPNESRPGLLLIGDPGTGKTHLAVAAFRQIIAQGHEGTFYDYQNLLDRIRSGYDANSNSADKEAYREALESPVLLLDDLGAHRVSEWVEDTITSIVTDRCNNRRTLIATTNLPDRGLGEVKGQKLPSGDMRYPVTLDERIGARARSRLFEMCTVIRMPRVEDHRIRKARTF